jgi:hypothetical protein
VETQPQRQPLAHPGGHLHLQSPPHTSESTAANIQFY